MLCKSFSRKDLLLLALLVSAAIGLWTELGPRVSGASRFLRPTPKRTSHHDGAIESSREILSVVNSQFAAHWRDAAVEPAPTADTLTLCRRLSLALTGTIPSFEELRMLEHVAEPDRIDWWLDHLFADRRYAQYVAERLARVYVGVEEGPFLVFRRRRFTTWLSDSLFENRGYDEIVRHLIADQGVWTEKPAVNFLTVTTTEGKPDEVRLAGRTARAFLGLRLDCVQCHDDNLGGPWRQSDFHALAAFYSEAENSITGVTDRPRAYKTKYLGATKKSAVLANVPFGQELVDRRLGTRRQRLAKWVTHPGNRAFGRAIVNRVWALIFGRPLVEPVDSIPLDGPYPPGLESLASNFAANDYDLQHLIRAIAGSDPFQRSSRGGPDDVEDPARSWAAFPVTRLRPDQIAGALLQSSKLTTVDAESHILVRLDRWGSRDDFVKRYGDTGEDEFGDHGGTVPQRLLMMNGKLVRERTKPDLAANAATRIARLSPSDEQAIRATFLTILTRNPTDTEQQHFLNRLDTLRTTDRPFDRDQFFEDLCWSLLNSAEFSWNH